VFGTIVGSAYSTATVARIVISRLDRMHITEALMDHQS